jgi:hypothetical protein
MMYYKDKSGSSRYALQDFEPTFRQKMSAATNEAWLESYGPVFSDWFKSRDEGGQEKLNEEDGKLYAESLGGYYSPDKPMTKKQIDFLSERQRELMTVQDIRSRTPWDVASPLRGLAMFGAGIIDPINLATTLVPWTRAIPALKGVAGVAATGTGVARIGARTALGAADAAISTAALELPYAAIRNELGDDYDAVDSLANIAFGAAFGGGIHAIGGVGSAIYRKYGPPSRRVQPDIPKVPDIQEPLTMASRFGELPDAVKTAVARAAAESPEIRQAFTEARNVDFSEAELIASIDSSVDAVVNRVAVTADRISNLEQAASRQAQPGEPLIVRANEDGTFEVLSGDTTPLRTQDTANQPVKAFNVGSILEQQPERVFAQPDLTARAQAQNATPQQREQALNAAMMQSIEGSTVDVTPVFEPTRTQVPEAIRKSMSPEKSRGADFEASRAIDQEPKQSWSTLADAEKSMSDAEKYLDEIIKAGDQAFKYSRGTDIDAGSKPTKETITQAIRKSFGKSTDALLERAQVEIVDSVKDIPNGPHPADVKAATAPDGKVYVVADNVSPQQMRGLLLHEVGVHVGMREVLGDNVFNDVLKQVDDAIARGDAWAMDAARAVPEDTNPLHKREEQLAYLVETQPELGIVQRIIAAIRAWAVKTFGAKLNLTPADLQALAALSLRHVARDGGMTGEFAFSRSGTIDVDGVERPTVNADGRPIAGTAEQVRNFWRWFGESKVVDDQGRPLVVYHGTNAKFNEFEKSKRGLFFTGKNAAKRYGDLIPVYLAIKKPIAANAQFRFWNELETSTDPAIITLQNKNKKSFLAADHLKSLSEPFEDGAIISNVVDEGGTETQYIAFNPEQIKSATSNVGTFDPTTADIRYSRGKVQDPNTAKDSLKPFDEQLEQAKKTGSAIRAAAEKLDNETQAIEAMRSAYPEINLEDARSYFRELQRNVNKIGRQFRTMEAMPRAEGETELLQSEAMNAANEMANNIEMAAVIEKRNAALNLAVEFKAKTFIAQFDKPELDVEGFMALLVGSERLRSASRNSVDAEYKGYRAKWLGGLQADLEKAGLLKTLSSGVFDRDIYDALYRMGEDGADLSDLPAEAVKLAELINKYQESARSTRNRFGAWIGDLKGYITRQTHDMFKLQNAGAKEWIDFVKPLLDLDRMREQGSIGNDMDSSLQAIYGNLSSGLHHKSQAGEVDKVAFKGPGNLAKKASQSRAIHFKDGQSAFEYNAKFGNGRLIDSVMFGLDNAAQSVSLLKKLGTNPEAMFTKLFDEYAESLKTDPIRAHKFASKRKRLLNALKQVDGTIRIPGNVTAAKIGSFMRSWMTMAKLGGSLLSSFTDLTGYAADVRFGQGKNLLEGTFESFTSLTNRINGKQKDILNSLGVFHESTLGGVLNRFDSPELINGKMASAMNTYFKFNGLSWWTESLRDGAALSYANFMGENSINDFGSLPDELKRVFKLYDVDEGKWELLRKATDTDQDGRLYVTPDMVQNIPETMLDDYLQANNRTASDVSRNNLRDDLSQSLRVLYVDRAHHAIPEPNARVRAFMQQGMEPGTLGGEFVRYVGQFKSFSVAMVQMVLGREVYGRGYDTLGDYLQNGKGDMLGLATYIALTTGIGYLVMAAKDLLKGREPRDPTDKKTWLAAAAQGGGLGLYGDFLFAEYSRFGGSFTASAAGPVFGLADTLFDLKTRIQTGDDSAAASFKALLDNTPFLNLFYLRVALDYSILYAIHEALNPGFLRRMEGRLRRENNQKFLFPPNQYANQF